MPIRPARAEDAEVLSDLAFRSKAHWGYADDFMEACRDELTYTPEQVASGDFHVLDSDGRIAGFYALTKISPDTAELEAMFVEPERIGEGCGRALMQDALSRAGSLEHIQRLVIQADPHAAEFYRRAGATLIGERPSDSIRGRTLPLFEIRIHKEH